MDLMFIVYKARSENIVGDICKGQNEILLDWKNMSNSQLLTAAYQTISSSFNNFFLDNKGCY